MAGGKAQSRRRMILMGVAMLGVVVLGRQYVSVENMRRNKASIEAFVAQHPLSAPLVICSVLVAVLACSLPGEMLLTAACGVLLSPWAVAVVTSWLAHVIGGVINFCILRLAWYGSLPPMWRSSERTILPTSHSSHGGGMDPEEEPMSPRSREWLDWINRRVRRAPPWLLCLLRVVPPLFGPLNAAMAVVDVPLSTYVWTTALGTLPAQIVLTLFARQVVDTILEEGETPAPPRSDMLLDDDDGPATNLWLNLLSPTTGILPPRIRPLNVLVVVPIVWFGGLYVAGHLYHWVRLPQSRMWRRHPLPHRSTAFTI